MKRSPDFRSSLTACMTASSKYRRWTASARPLPDGRTNTNRFHWPDIQRSEEHTSELQSHLNLVCRLLLEKKKKESEFSTEVQIECGNRVKKEKKRAKEWLALCGENKQEHIHMTMHELQMSTTHCGGCAA